MGLKGFSNADGPSQYHWHSISGYIFTIDGGAVSWSSKKQAIVALSMTEAEYIAATHAVKEALWIQMFLSKVTHPLTHPVTLYCNNHLPWMFLRMTNSMHEWSISIFDTTSSVTCPSGNYSLSITAPPLICLPIHSPKPYLHHSWHTCVTWSVCILLKGEC